MTGQYRPVWFTDDDYEAVDVLSGYFRPGDLAYDWICSLQKRAHAAPADPAEAVLNRLRAMYSSSDLVRPEDGLFVLRALGAPDD